ncbi:hypothetical protein SO802_022206 [Lithocarpus litseifolius]|uniref:Uncharacterized protein n=1 Tax=Lithocarpus litseifolius TaxID=425828 RepID=A0AAW2CH55_9ROSI
MAAAVTELTCQNQELTREITLRRQRHERYVEGQAQSQEVKEEGNAKHKNQLRGTSSRRVPHLEREMDQMRKAMDEMREKIRRANLAGRLVRLEQAASGSSRVASHASRRHGVVSPA